MVSLARAKTPFPARAAEPSKRAAIIDVPSLAPPSFSLPPLDPPGNQGQSSSARTTHTARRGAARRGAARPLKRAEIFPRHGRATFCGSLAECRREEKPNLPVPPHRASYDGDSRKRES